MEIKRQSLQIVRLEPHAELSEEETNSCAGTSLSSYGIYRAIAPSQKPTNPSQPKIQAKLSVDSMVAKIRAEYEQREIQQIISLLQLTTNT